MHFSDRVNNITGAHGTEWNVETCHKYYTLVPDTQECCVHPGIYHTFSKMSCIKVYELRAVCCCNIHGERVIESEMSRRIRSLFFVYPYACKHRQNEDIILQQNYDFLYFIVSRHAVFKDKLYGKFGNYKGGGEKQRFLKYDTHNPSYIYASVSYNTRAIHEHCGLEHKYLDNFINNKILNNASIPLVNLKNTDWFEITQEASENVIEFFIETKRKNKHPMLSNGSNLAIFIQNICKHLKTGNTIKKDFVNICEFCGYTKFTHNNCSECSATNKTLNDYIHMFLTLPIDCSDNAIHFVKQKGAFMFLQDFKKKFYNYMYLEYPNVEYRWTSDYSTFEKLGYKINYINVCKCCNSRSKTGCCSEYNTTNRSRRYIIEDICYI